MNALVERLTTTLDVFGEPILLDSEEVKSFVRVVSPAEARLYLTEAVVSGSGRPIRAFFVGPDVTATIGDSIGWQDDTYLVAFIRPYRFAGEDIGFGLIAVLP